MAESFDIAILGGGPAGLCAARNIVMQTNAPRTVLIEKDNDSNKNIPCAEGVGRLGFHEVLQPKESWIRSIVSCASFHSPDNTTITYTDKDNGYIINRARMQHDLINECQELGAEGRFGQSAIHISKPNIKGYRSVHMANGSVLEAQIIIDCSGPFSTIGKQENIDWKPKDLEIAYFAHVENVKTNTDTVHVYVGIDIAPGGYAWAFPRNQESLNVGIVLGSSFRGKTNIKNLLFAFINKHFPKGKVVRQCAGCIPCFYEKSIVASHGLIKSGDAMSTVNPISRAGISEAMKSGTLAGTIALRMLGTSTEKEMNNLCKEYGQLWNKKLGNRHSKLAKVKKSLLKVSDNDYNKGAHALSKIPLDQLTMSKIFTLSLGKFPKLVWALRHLM